MEPSVGVAQGADTTLKGAVEGALLGEGAAPSEDSANSEDEASAVPPTAAAAPAEAAAPVPRGAAEYEAYYAAQQLCPAAEWKLSLERLHLPLPPCFRVRLGSGAEAPLAVLKSWSPEAVPWCPGAFRISSAEAVNADGFLEASLAAALTAAQRAGHLSRQETASMLPAIALGIQPHHKVLELCAAPGSKTLQILDMMHDSSSPANISTGLLVSNDYKLVRLKKLIDRTRRVPAEPLLVTCADAKRFPNILSAKDAPCDDGLSLRSEISKVRYDRIFCDVPCSGDGTVRKAKGILAQWTPRGGLAHHEDQLMILKKGIEMLEPGGILAYSTCALNPVECEAVVAAALSHAGGCVEVVPVDVPGLRMAEGLTSWRVPSSEKPRAGEDPPPGGICYTSWDEVPEVQKSSGGVRRSMFPPAAYAGSAEAADAITTQLKHCARLLPAHDNGGCFFLTMLRRVENVEAPSQRGDKVIVRRTNPEQPDAPAEEEMEAIVRGPGSGRYLGKVRVAYPDGSSYHVWPKEMRRCGGKTSSDVPGKKAGKAQAKQERLLRDVDSSVYEALSSFYGLISDPDQAALAGVEPFPREALVYSLDHDDASERGASVCLASTSLRHITKAPKPVAAARAVFFRSGPLNQGKGWPVDAFPWRPAAEVATLLGRCCSRRVVRPGIDVAKRLLAEGSVDAAELGVQEDWESGSLIVEILRDAGIVLVGLLHEGRVSLCTRAEIRRHFTAVLESIAGSAEAAAVS